MKRMVLKLFVVVGVAVAVAAGILMHHHRNREQFFFAQAFEQLRAGRGDKPMITIDFKAGGSASVILEHACCSGAGFDAVAIRTSDGKEFQAAKNYCGLEEFRLALGAESTQSLTNFTAFLAQRGYRKN